MNGESESGSNSRFPMVGGLATSASSRSLVFLNGLGEEICFGDVLLSGMRLDSLEYAILINDESDGP